MQLDLFDPPPALSTHETAPERHKGILHRPGALRAADGAGAHESGAIPARCPVTNRPGWCIRSDCRHGRQAAPTPRRRDRSGGAGERRRLRGPAARYGPAAARDPSRIEAGGASWRYRGRGSLAVHVGGSHAGACRDHEAGAGSGTLALIEHAVQTDKAGALAWLVDARLIAPPAGADARPAAPRRAAAARVSASIRPESAQSGAAVPESLPKLALGRAVSDPRGPPILGIHAVQQPPIRPPHSELTFRPAAQDRETTGSP